LSRWKNWNTRIHGMTTRTRSQSLFTTHSREKERARFARTLFTALSRSQSSFFYIALRSRGWFNNLFFFPRKKMMIFQNPYSSWKPTTKQKPALSKGFKTRRERERAEQRKEREREKERERKKEHVPVDLRAVCLVRAILNDFFCGVFSLF